MAPRKFFDTEAPDTLIDESQYSEALLLAHEDAKDLADGHNQFAEAVKKVINEQSGYKKAELIAQAFVDQQNYQLDQETLALERAIKRAIEDAGDNNATQSPKFKSYFKEEPRRLRDRGLETQVSVMKKWPTLLRAEPEPALKDWADTLEARFQKAEEVLQARRDAQAKTRSHRVQEILPLFEQANNLRQDTHGELSKRTTKKNLGREWPDSFFRVQDHKEPAVIGELRRSLYLALEAKSFTPTDEQRKQIDSAAEKGPLLRWLLNAGAAKNLEEVLS